MTRVSKGGKIDDQRLCCVEIVQFISEIRLTMTAIRLLHLYYFTASSLREVRVILWNLMGVLWDIREALKSNRGRHVKAIAG